MEKFKRFTGNEQHNVTQAEVVEFTQNFRNSFGSNFPPGGFVDKTAVMSLIQQKQAVGMRYYYGLGHNGETHLLFVGTNSFRNDLLDGEAVKLSASNPALTNEGTYDSTAIDHEISMENAAKLTANYQEQNESSQPIGGFFGKQAILRILEQKDCIGMRFYYGANNAGIRVMCLMGVDITGKDMFNGQLAELSMGCPPWCGNRNPLNYAMHSSKTADL